MTCTGPGGVSNPVSVTVAVAPQPSIHISGADGSQVSDSSISANVGDTFTISGVPQNLQGMSYYTGSGSPPSGYYNRAFFFDQNFSNNNSCTNNDGTSGTWTMTCTAKVAGSSAFYVEIYANGQTYQSNTVTVTIAGATSQAQGLNQMADILQSMQGIMQSLSHLVP
jgi:hypothetical protein